MIMMRVKSFNILKWFCVCGGLVIIRHGDGGTALVLSYWKCDTFAKSVLSTTTLIFVLGRKFVHIIFCMTLLVIIIVVKKGEYEPYYKSPQKHMCA